MVCVLPWTQGDLFFLESPRWSIVLPSPDSSIWCSLNFFRFQGPGSGVPFPPWYLGLTWAPQAQDPGPGVLSSNLGFLTCLSSPMPPYGSSVHCLLNMFQDLLFHGHCGEHPLADYALFIVFIAVSQEVCQFLHRNIYWETMQMSFIHPNSISLKFFCGGLLYIKYHSHSISNLDSSFSILWLKIIDVV